MRKLRFAVLLILVSMLFGCRALRLPGFFERATASAVLWASASPAASLAVADSSARSGTATSPSPVATSAGRQQVLDAFRLIAFGAEYGGDSGRIRKFSAPVQAAVHGSPTRQDESMLAKLFEDLNAVDGFPGIALADDNPNMDIWFLPLDDMMSVLPGYVEGNWGFFTTQYDDQGITSVKVAIASDVTTQMERNHLIQEEIIQSTGLMQDFYDYPDSIFYGQWSTVQTPSPMDWDLVGMLYMPQLTHGMAEADAMELIDRLYDPSSKN